MFGVSFLMSAITLGGLALGAFGAKKQYEGERDVARASQEASAASARAEEARFKQMQLDARRRELEIQRNVQRTRATALARTSSQGAQFGSALPGAYAQITQEGGRQTLALEQNLEIGEQIFEANQDVFEAQSRGAAAQGRAAMGKGLYGFGRDLIAVSEPAARIGSTLFGGNEERGPR